MNVASLKMANELRYLLLTHHNKEQDRRRDGLFVWRGFHVRCPFMTHRVIRWIAMPWPLLDKERTLGRTGAERYERYWPISLQKSVEGFPGQ
jgi:hypothetical protein